MDDHPRIACFKRRGRAPIHVRADSVISVEQAQEINRAGGTDYADIPGLCYLNRSTGQDTEVEATVAEVYEKLGWGSPPTE